MRKAFALIAKGLIEKEQLLQKEPTRYPYSKALQHGINMFLAASQRAGSQVAVKYPDEAAFLAYFITRPIEEWFDTWESGVVEQLHLQEEPFMPMTPLRIKKPVMHMFPAQIAMSSWKRRIVIS